MKNNKNEFKAKIEGKEWEEALDKAFKKKIKEVKIDGFRKGKAPRRVYENKFGKESLYMDAIDIVIPKAFQKVMSDEKIIPVAQPTVDIKSVDEKGVELVFIIITKPEVKIKKYKNLKIEKPKIEVTDEEIEQEIKTLQRQYAEIVIKDSPIELEDTAVIDYEGFKDGKPFKGGKGENFPLEIGSNTFIPGFEEQLIGLKANDEKEIEVTFPKDYPSKELANEKVTFKVRVNEVKTRVIPELNDEFFKDLGMENVTNKKELINVIKKELKRSKEIDIENTHIDNILKAIAKDTKVDIPDEMIDEEIHRMIHQLEERLKMQGITLEQYYQFTNSNHEQLHEKFHDEAKKTLIYRLIIEEISKLENIEATDQEAQEELTKMGEKYHMDEKELLKAFGSLDVVKYDLKMRKTFEFLKANN